MIPYAVRILVYGAGNIGSLYAARLAQSSQDVAILARGTRLEQIRQQGIERRVQSGQVVIIAKASKPIARIVPLHEAASSGRSFGAFKGWIESAPDAFDASDEVADLFETGDIFPG